MNLYESIEQNNLKLLLPNFHKGQILIYGDVMLDRYWYGSTSRISPEAPVPIVHVHDQLECPGGAGNVALNLVTLGAEVHLLGSIGDDEAGETLQRILSDHKVANYLLKTPNKTTTKLRLLSANQQLVRMDFEETVALETRKILFKQYQQILSKVNLVILSDYNKGCLSEPQEFIKLAKQMNLPVLIDPKQSDFSVYNGATIVTPNFSEFTMVVGECATEAIILEKAVNLMDQHDFQAILVTRGAQGMTLIQRDGSHFSLSAKAPEVYDVTGAGDTVVAVLAGAVATGESLPAAVRLANTAAGIVVGRLGAACVNLNELQQAIEQQKSLNSTPANSKIVDLVKLQQEVKHCRAQAESVALLIGEFDILSTQHLSLLKKISKTYDRIIVGVTDDSLSHGHNAHSFLARQTAMAGFLGLDWVIGLTNQEWPVILEIMTLDKVYFASKNRKLCALLEKS